jgi:hypothetical protein
MPGLTDDPAPPSRRSEWLIEAPSQSARAPDGELDTGSPWVPAELARAAPSATELPPSESPWATPAAVRVDDRQRQAVEAYTGRLLDGELAAAAAQDAIDGYESSLAARGGQALAPGAQHEYLLSLTRLMAAVSLPDRSGPEDRRRAVLASIGDRSHCTCREAAALLAARANGNIEARQADALDAHLEECAHCRELSAAMVAAEAAFRSALAPPGGGGLLQARNVLLLSSGLVALLVAGALVLVTGGGGSGSGTHLAHASARTTPAAHGQAAGRSDASAARRGTGPGRHHAPRHRVAHHAHHHTASTATSLSRTRASTTPASAAPAAGRSEPAVSAPAAGAAVPVTSAPAPPPAAPATPAASVSSSGSSSLGAASAPQSGIGSVGSGG